MLWIFSSINDHNNVDYVDNLLHEIDEKLDALQLITGNATNADSLKVLMKIADLYAYIKDKILKSKHDIYYLCQQQCLDLEYKSLIERRLKRLQCILDKLSMTECSPLLIEEERIEVKISPELPDNKYIDNPSITKRNQIIICALICLALIGLIAAICTAYFS